MTSALLQRITAVHSIALIAACAVVGTVNAQNQSAQEAGRELARQALEAADANGDDKVSREEVSGPARLFPRADEDGDGFLTLPEFERGMVPPDDAVASSLGPEIDDEILLDRLQAGGLVIVFRHGKTHRDQTDSVRPAIVGDLPEVERQAMFLDCSLQRTLTDEGREELRDIAAAIGNIGFVVHDLQSSPMCRTRETAWLAFGRVTPNDALVSPRGLADRRRLAGTVPPEGTNQVIVSHSRIVASIVWYPNNPANPAQIGLPEGTAFIVEALGDSNYRFLKHMALGDWQRLAEIAQARR
jgi:phosphohistidine phosphatase SixA